MPRTMLVAAYTADKYNDVVYYTKKGTWDRDQHEAHRFRRVKDVKAALNNISESDKRVHNPWEWNLG